MALTKKDFKAIAEQLKYARPINTPMSAFFSSEVLNQWKEDCDRVAKGLAYTNPDFKKNLFLEACGYFDAGND